MGVVLGFFGSAGVRLPVAVTARCVPQGRAAGRGRAPGELMPGGGWPGQQSLTEVVTLGFGGGQLMAVCPAGRPRGRGAAVGCVPLMHLGSVHSMTAAAGGTPLMQSGVVHARGAETGSGPAPHAELAQAPAAVAVRLSEPAARAAEITALAATRLTMFTGMALLPVRCR